MAERGKNDRLRILHLCSEKTWRGGERQTVLLIQGSMGDCQHHVAAPEGSAILEVIGYRVPTLKLSFSVIHWPWTLWRLLGYCRTHGIGIIDCQSAKAHSIGLALKVLLPGLRLLVHRRVDNIPRASWWHRWKYLSSRVDGYVAISHCIQRGLVNYGVQSYRVHMVYSATPAPQAVLAKAVARQQVLPPGAEKVERVLVSVGYLTPQKGFATLLAALAQLRSSYCCLIAGDGPLRTELELLSRQLGIEHHVHFLGIRRDVDALLDAADVFVLASNNEGLGTSLLDATHRGCALVATRVGGIPEFVEHGVSGLLSAPGDATALAHNLQVVLQDESLQQTLIHGAKSKLEQHFSLRQMIAGNLGVYKTISSQS